MKRFAVIGLGRFGQKLAIALAMSGAEVIAIDKDRDQIELIADQVSHAVRLDSTDEEALKAQGVDKVDVAIIGIGQSTGGFEVRADQLLSPCQSFAQFNLDPVLAHETARRRRGSRCVINELEVCKQQLCRLGLGDAAPCRSIGASRFRSGSVLGYVC